MSLFQDIPTASLKEVYIDFYHSLVEAVSDEVTCQSLLTQLSSYVTILEEKIAQLISSKATGSSFLKTLGLEEEPHLLVPLVSAMSRVKQLQTLAEKMSALMTDKQGIFFFPLSVNTYTHVVTAGFSLVKNHSLVMEPFLA